MKTKLILLLLIFINISAFAKNSGHSNEFDHDFRFTKKKNIDANFALNENYLVKFDGRYSDVKISTWKEDNISFHIEITAKANKELSVDKVLQAIDVDFNNDKTNNILEVTTLISTNKMDRRVGYEIVYYIMIPENIRLSIENIYGDVTINKLYKDFNLNLRYGDLTIDSLFSTNNIDIMYGDVRIKHAKSANTVIRYGDIELNKSDKLKIDIMYGDVNLSNISKLEGSFRYSDITCNSCDTAVIDIMYTDADIKNVNEIHIDDSYGDVKIDNLNGKLKFSANYSDLNVESISKDFELIDIKANYSDIEINLNEEHSFTYDINLLYGSSYSGDLLEKYATRIINKDSKSIIIGNYNDPEQRHKLSVRGSYSDFYLDD